MANVNIHNRKFTILIIFKYAITWHLYSHNVLPTITTNFKTFSSFQTEILYPLNNNSLSCSSHLLLCFLSLWILPTPYISLRSRIIQHLCSVTGFFPLSTSLSFIHVTACVGLSFLHKAERYSTVCLLPHHPSMNTQVVSFWFFVCYFEVSYNKREKPYISTFFWRKKKKSYKQITFWAIKHILTNSKEWITLSMLSDHYRIKLEIGN